MLAHDDDDIVHSFVRSSCVRSVVVVVVRRRRLFLCRSFVRSYRSFCFRSASSLTRRTRALLASFVHSRASGCHRSCVLSFVRSRVRSFVVKVRVIIFSFVRSLKISLSFLSVIARQINVPFVQRGRLFNLSDMSTHGLNFSPRSFSRSYRPTCPTTVSLSPVHSF